MSGDRAPGVAPRIVHAALLATVAAAGFFGTARGLAALRAEPVFDELADKLRYLERADSGVNALLLGASGIFHGLDPNVLDAQVADAAPDFKSFNLGARGMRGLESDAALRAAVAILGDRLEVVVLEPKPFHPWTYAGSSEIGREQRWHTARQTVRALRLSLAAARAGQAGAGRWGWQHFAAFARGISGYGTSERLWERLAGPAPAGFLDVEALERWRGYAPIEFIEPPDAPARRARFAAEPEEYAASVALTRDRVGAPAPQLEASRALIAEQAAWLESRGIEVLYLMAPYVRRGQFELILGSVTEHPGALNFADPERFPELYAREARLDAQHLDAAGAAEFSRLAGAAIAAELKRRKTP